jgi:hypothetical protein
MQEFIILEPAKRFGLQKTGPVDLAFLIAVATVVANVPPSSIGLSEKFVRRSMSPLPRLELEAAVSKRQSPGVAEGFRYCVNLARLPLRLDRATVRTQTRETSVEQATSTTVVLSQLKRTLECSVSRLAILWEAVPVGWPVARTTDPSSLSSELSQSARAEARSAAVVYRFPGSFARHRRQIFSNGSGTSRHMDRGARGGRLRTASR